MRQGSDRHQFASILLDRPFSCLFGKLFALDSGTPKTNLVSNADRAARVTDPQLINPGACPGAPEVRVGYRRGLLLERPK